MISVPLIRYVLMAALRDRLVISLILVILLGSCLSLFLGSSAIIETNQFSLVFAASGLRFAGVVGLVLFVVFHIRRSFDNKDVDFLLSRPISRTGFILSHAVAFSLIAFALAAAVDVVIIVMSFGKVGPAYGLWMVSLIMEYIVMVNAALFFSMVVSSASSAALAVFGLYVLSRLMGELLGDARHSATLLGDLLAPVMNLVAMVMPRLDLLAQTTWLVYPDAATNVGYLFILAQGVAYAGLLACAALIDLRRRQF